MQELKGAKVSVEEVLEDQTEQKARSHTLLQAMLAKQPTIFKSRVYKKEELKLLLRLYGISFSNSCDKDKLSDLLVKRITEELGFPSVTSNMQQGTYYISIHDLHKSSVDCNARISAMVNINFHESSKRDLDISG